MTRMPSRPREHQIEDESRLIFQSALPRAWAVQEVRPDYGIDVRVEVFRADGAATGMMFFAQLRSTDEPDLSKALRVRFSTSTLLYYAAVDLPVLIVRYHAPTRQLFARWYHTFQLNFSDTQQTLTLNLSETDEWRNDQPDALVAKLNAVQSLVARALTLPFRVELQVEGGFADQRTPRAVPMQIRAGCTRLADALALEDASGERLPTVAVSDEGIEVDLLGTSRVTLKIERCYEPSETGTRIPCDLVVAIAIALGQVGQSALAARLALESFPSSTFVGNAEIAMRVGGVLIASHRDGDLVHLASQLVGRGEAHPAAQVLGGLVLLRWKQLSDEKRQEYEEVLRHEATYANTTSDHERAAAAHYNLGNLLRSQGRPDEALTEYETARVRDPSYGGRFYYHYELGGIFFGLHRYTDAAETYRVAVSLGAGDMAQALLADALLFSGNYADALQEFRAHLADAPDADGEWHLKLVALEFLDDRGFVRQDRQVDAAVTLASIEEPAPPVNELVDRLKRAVDADALCGLAWFNLAVLRSHTGESDLFQVLLLAALMLERDPTVWSLALAAAASLPAAVEHIPRIASTASRLCGQPFVDAVVDALPNLMERAQAEEVFSVVDEAMRREALRREQVDLRFASGGEFETLRAR